MNENFQSISNDREKGERLKMIFEDLNRDKKRYERLMNSRTLSLAEKTEYDVLCSKLSIFYDKCKLFIKPRKNGPGKFLVDAYVRWCENQRAIMESNSLTLTPLINQNIAYKNHHMQKMHSGMDESLTDSVETYKKSQMVAQKSQFVGPGNSNYAFKTPFTRISNLETDQRRNIIPAIRNRNTVENVNVLNASESPVFINRHALSRNNEFRSSENRTVGNTVVISAKRIKNPSISVETNKDIVINETLNHDVNNDSLRSQNEMQNINPVQNNSIIKNEIGFKTVEKAKRHTFESKSYVHQNTIRHTENSIGQSNSIPAYQHPDASRYQENVFKKKTKIPVKKYPKNICEFKVNPSLQTKVKSQSGPQSSSLNYQNFEVSKQFKDEIGAKSVNKQINTTMYKKEAKLFNLNADFLKTIKEDRYYNESLRDEISTLIKSNGKQEKSIYYEKVDKFRIPMLIMLDSVYHRILFLAGMIAQSRSNDKKIKKEDLVFAFNRVMKDFKDGWA